MQPSLGLHSSFESITTTLVCAIGVQAQLLLDRGSRGHGQTSSVANPVVPWDIVKKVYMKETDAGRVIEVVHK